MEIHYPTGQIQHIPHTFLNDLPQSFHIYTQYLPNEGVVAYARHVKAAAATMIATAATEFEELKSVADAESWLIALDACKCHLEVGEFDDMMSALDALDIALEAADDIPDGTYESIRVYIDEWRDSACARYKKYVEFVEYIDTAAAHGCFAIINSH